MIDQATANPLVTEDDPWTDAEKAQAPTLIRTNFGQLDVDIFRCVLLKGQGKQLFDPAVHNSADKRTAIELTIVPLASSRFHDPIKREIIAESKEWTQIVRPSLQALQVDPRTLAGRFAQVDMVPSGRTWDDKRAGHEGEKVQGTTFKFIRFFDNEADCEAAAAAFFDRSNPPLSTAASLANTSGNVATAQAAAPTGNFPDPQRETAVKFLSALWKKANGDVSAFGELLAGNPLTAKHFDLSSTEVIALVNGGAK